MPTALTRLERLAFWALVGLTAATRLAVAFADHRSLINSEIYSDDAFYYLKIAQNVAAGRGLTFDGISVTNGFHPLYLGLLLPLCPAAPRGDLGISHPCVRGVAGAFRRGHGGHRISAGAAPCRSRSALAALALWAASPIFRSYTA